MRPRTLVCCPVLLLAACGPAESPSVAVELRDSAGITIVENRGAGWDSAAAWQVASEPMLVLGADAATPAEAFTYPMAGARLSDGRIAVVEGSAHELRYFDAEGRHLLTAGGQGEGPGEFRSIGFITRLPGDSLAVSGEGNSKVVVFGPEGAVARTITIDRSAMAALDGAGRCYAARWLPDGSMTACVTEPGGPESVRGEGGLSHIGFGLVRTRSRFVLLDAGLTRSDTLGLNGSIEQFGADVGRDVPGYFIHPFYSMGWTAVGTVPPRFYAAVNPAYAIDVAGSAGERRIIRRTGALRPVSPELREAAAEQLAGRGGDDPLQARALEQMPVPDSLPAVQGLVVDTDGNLWVKRSHSLEEGPIVHDVFDPDGRFLGAVQLPQGLNVMEIGADYVLGVRFGEMDVPVIELYRLTRE